MDLSQLLDAGAKCRVGVEKVGVGTGVIDLGVESGEKILVNFHLIGDWKLGTSNGCICSGWVLGYNAEENG